MAAPPPHQHPRRAPAATRGRCTRARQPTRSGARALAPPPPPARRHPRGRQARPPAAARARTRRPPPKGAPRRPPRPTPPLPRTTHPPAHTHTHQTPQNPQQRCSPLAPARCPCAPRRSSRCALTGAEGNYRAAGIPDLRRGATGTAARRVPGAPRPRGWAIAGRAPAMRVWRCSAPSGAATLRERRTARSQQGDPGALRAPRPAAAPRTPQDRGTAPPGPARAPGWAPPAALAPRAPPPTWRAPPTPPAAAPAPAPAAPEAQGQGQPGPRRRRRGDLDGACAGCRSAAGRPARPPAREPGAAPAPRRGARDPARPPPPPPPPPPARASPQPLTPICS
jgi:hypothetical protein